jgi:hypothetical protein
MGITPHKTPLPDDIVKMRAEKWEKALVLLREAGAVIDVTGGEGRAHIIVDETNISSNEDGSVTITIDGHDISHHVGICNVQFVHNKFPTLSLVLIPRMVKLSAPV